MDEARRKEALGRVIRESRGGRGKSLKGLPHSTDLPRLVLHGLSCKRLGVEAERLGRSYEAWAGKQW